MAVVQDVQPDGDRSVEAGGSAEAPRADVNIWARDDVYGCVLLVEAVDKFGTEFLSFSPETWRAEIRDTFLVEPSDASIDRLAVAVSIATSPDPFFNTVRGFDVGARVLSSAVEGRRFDPRDLADLYDCLWAGVEAQIIDRDHQPYSDFVKEYVKVCRLAYSAHGDSANALFDSLFGPGTDPGEDKDAVDDGTDEWAAAFAGKEASNRQLVAYITSGLQDLSEQFRSLVLRGGNAKQLADHIAQSLLGGGSGD